MSIVLGVIHMTFALCLQLPNHLRRNRLVDLYHGFIPQMLFLQSIFGYLVVCIIYKWLVDWSKSTIPPPSLLNMLIGMFLSPGSIEEENRLYRGQGFVQTVLLLIAAVCVPWMLCVKPYLLWKEMKGVQRDGYSGLPGNDDDYVTRHEDLGGEEEGHGRAIAADMNEEHEQHDFGEVVIHQVIHTIEFCLGCISHTASYLRLWALSLAHAQLSEVLWDMTLAPVLESESKAALFFILPMWFGNTLFILCIMEGLSAFLHALRLHWVEANSKFYEGGGHQFKPLNFAALDEKD